MIVGQIEKPRGSRTRVKQELLTCGITDELSQKWAYGLVPFNEYSLLMDDCAIEVVTRLRKMLEHSNQERQRLENELQSEREFRQRIVDGLKNLLEEAEPTPTPALATVEAMPTPPPVVPTAEVTPTPPPAGDPQREPAVADVARAKSIMAAVFGDRRNALTKWKDWCKGV